MQKKNTLPRGHNTQLNLFSFRLAGQGEDGCKSWHSFVGVGCGYSKRHTTNNGLKQISVASLGISPQHNGIFFCGGEPMEKEKPDVEKRLVFGCQESCTQDEFQIRQHLLQFRL